ncbi:MAG: sulfotransferase family protein [Isosphaeraceae bacterium]
MDSEVIIVSGLPRSGTSLMMQMLHGGGIEVVTDNIRTADTDNPRGYFEFERVKKIKEDKGWLPDARGKAVKMISQLLFDLPDTERYRVVFMQRDLMETLISQEKMLERRNREAAPREDIERAFVKHLDKLHAWLEAQPNFTVLYVKYADLVANPEQEARRINEFLGGQLDVRAMAAAVDPKLYRNRKGEGS